PAATAGPAGRWGPGAAVLGRSPLPVLGAVVRVPSASASSASGLPADTRSPCRANVPARLPVPGAGTATGPSPATTTPPARTTLRTSLPAAQAAPAPTARARARTATQARALMVETS